MGGFYFWICVRRRGVRWSWRILSCGLRKINDGWDSGSIGWLWEVIIGGGVKWVRVCGVFGRRWEGWWCEG